MTQNIKKLDKEVSHLIRASEKKRGTSEKTRISVDILGSIDRKGRNCHEAQGSAIHANGRGGNGVD